MSKYSRYQQILKLVSNEDKLRKMKKGELNKILYTSNVNDDVNTIISLFRKKAMSREYTRISRLKYKRIISELQTEKDHLKTEKQILEAEINLYGNLMKN